MEITTRIEEENRVVPPAKKSEITALSDGESTEDDEQLEGLSTFDIATARDDLYKLKGCHVIMLNQIMQKNLGIEVGINVSQEFPWKRISFSLLTKAHFFYEIENGEFLRQFFTAYKPNDKVLMGYAPSLITEDEDMTTDDPFVIYANEINARAAAAIIRNIEIYERFMMNKSLIKRPREWASKGSEYEVNLGIPPKKSEVVDVEIQSVYPMRQSRVKFELRRTCDVRDGYAELIGGDVKFQNVTQHRVHIGVQSAPETVTLEQQTDPTFPSNAWAQYLYEIKEEEEDGLDVSSEEEQEVGKSAATSKTVTPSTDIQVEPKPLPEMSEQVKYLLSTLEFNQVDMYRNDYPLISTAPVRIYTNPHLEEIFCFANISKSNNRYVSAVDWYPYLTGIVVAAYAFTTKVTLENVTSTQKVDAVQRAILQPNPILLWSFTDSLNFKLEFESPREVTALSFCPYDDNLLIGGTINGQIIIWDLQDRAKNLDAEEHLTIAQANNRELMAEFLSWTIQYDEKTRVFPAAISALDYSQTSAIAEIKWLSRDQYISPNGKIHESYLNAKSRYFATLSIDGSLAYWNLNYDIGNVARASAKKNLPAALTQNESVYKMLDRLIKPVFMITYPEPLTSVICDVANFTYTPQVDIQSVNDSNVKTFPIVVKECDQSQFRNSFIVGSFFGRIDVLNFEGCETGAVVNKENITAPLYSFARVHDGPIVALERNPFWPELFVSVGRTVMAVWREDFPFTPIFWRVRPKILTGVKWSSDRPGVLFLTRNDGSFEAWDLLTQDEEPCLVEVLGGGVITVLSEHRAVVPKKVISIGDYNSSFRMVALPEGFYKPVPNELKRVQVYVDKEVNRKKSIQTWQQNWTAENAKIIEEKKRIEAEEARELARQHAAAEELKQQKESFEDKKTQSVPTSAAHFELAEKSDKKWNELNLKRLMHNLMVRKQVDPEKLDRETALEKQRLRYEQRKKESIQAAIAKVSEEIAAIRGRLLPVEKKDLTLSDMVSNFVSIILRLSPSYADVESEALSFLEEAPSIPPISYENIKKRCQERRQLLNRALGVPYDRIDLCEQERTAGGFKEWDHGTGEFLHSLEECTRGSSKSTSTLYSDLDLVPQRDSKEM